MNTAELILERAREAGFDLVGLAPLRAPRDAARFEAWLAAGHHAGMGWLEHQRERILDPRRIDPAARTLLVVGMAHGRPAVEVDGVARVARYAAGRDYHNALTRRLRKLARALVEDGLAGPSRTIVDAGPLLERSHAEEAGIGFASKAANLLHPDHGPWFFLGELLLDVELDPTPTPPPGGCGTCTLCIDACPTDALFAAGQVDAGRCLSYQNIENRGSIPHGLRAALGPHVFGCDVCSEVCPWGKDAGDHSADWGTHPLLEAPLVDWLRIPEEAFAARLQGSPLRRPKRSGLLRNAALVLGNRPSEAGRAVLEVVLEEEPDPLLRAAAFWALLRGHSQDEGTPARLGAAQRREPDLAAARDMELSRELLGP